MISVREMCIFFQDKKDQVHHRIYLTFLRDPRLRYESAASTCGICRNTLSKYWNDGLQNLIFYLPQCRLKMFEDLKEYIYLIQSDSAHELFEYFKDNPSLVYIAYLSGKFDIFLQTSKPLDILPDRTLFYGSRGNYIYPETPFYSYETALNRIEMLTKQEHTPYKIPVEYPKEPPEEGSSHYGKMIFPYVKYNMRIGYTQIAKNLHISFTSFSKGLEYLFNVSTVLLPFYPLGFNLYTQYFFIFWSNYEDLLVKSFSYLPCFTSINKVGDALVVYTSAEKGLYEKRLFQFYFKLKDMGYIERFWSSIPIYHRIPSIPDSTRSSST